MLELFNNDAKRSPTHPPLSKCRYTIKLCDVKKAADITDPALPWNGQIVENIHCKLPKNYQ